ncbi:MAG: DsrE family protein [Marinifilaceae bacterium]|jgi:intracellular sulfur oxidation DsrE/DsrF family protein|nr:DsrE family protein [Marinifilaceae bacterium]
MDKNTLIQVKQYGMGIGDQELSLKLISNYFKLIIAENKLPKIIVFYNEAVKLLCHDDLIDYKKLDEKGVKILACKTCIEYYELTDKIIAGQICTMNDIITLQADASKVISL